MRADDQASRRANGSASGALAPTAPRRVAAVVALALAVLAVLVPAAGAGTAPGASAAVGCAVDAGPGSVRADLGTGADPIAGTPDHWWAQAAAATGDWDGDGRADGLAVGSGRATVRFGSSSLTISGLSSSSAAAARWDVTGDGVVDLVVTGGGRVAVVVGGPAAVPAADRTLALDDVGTAIAGWTVAGVVVRGPSGSATAVPGDEAEVRPLWDLDGDGVGDVGVYTPAPRSAGPWAYVTGRPCAGRGVGARSSLAAPRRSLGTLGRPPVLDADVPDPTVIYADGAYHLYSTNVFSSGWFNVPHHRSVDLQHWEQRPDALPAPGPWASTTSGYVWAPSVHRFGSTWVLYYTARVRSDAGWAAGRQCIGRAVAASPDGPFVDTSPVPLVCQIFQGGSIDPDVHVAADGAPWLLVKNDGNCCALPVSLWSVPLAADGLAVAGAPVRLLDRDQPWEEPAIENPTMAAVDGTDVLLYSGGPFASDRYAIGFATCWGAAGPCTKLSTSTPFLGSDAVAVGPGGQDLFTDSRRQSWMAYHGWIGGTSYGNGAHRAAYVERLRTGPLGFYLDPSTPYEDAGPSVPAAPTGLGARPGFGNVTLWWNAPPDDLGYPVQQVQIALTDAQGHVFLFVIEGGTRSYVLPFLVDGTYSATIKLSNELGYGPASDPVSFTVSSDGSRYRPVTPTRILDTRDGTGGVTSIAMLPGQTLVLPVAGTAGLPPAGQVAAVTVDVTATQGTSDTHLTLWPGDVPDPPATSSLNVGAGRTVAKHVTVAVGDDGTVRLRNNSGFTHVLVDLTGWYGLPGATAGSLFRTVAPTRVLDTRDGTGVAAGSVGPQSSIALPVAGRAGLPADPAQVRAVVLNVTATQPTAVTHVRAWPGAAGPPPLASVLNADAGQTVANLVTVGVGGDGKVSLYNQSGQVHLIADLVGWYGADGGSVGAVFHPLTPGRLADTRTALGFAGPVVAGTPQTLPLNGHVGLPMFPAATAVVATVTAVLPSADTHVTAYPRGPLPGTSTLNLPARTVLANEAVVPTDAGWVSFATNTGSTDLVVDLQGWFRQVG